MPFGLLTDHIKTLIALKLDYQSYLNIINVWGSFLVLDKDQVYNKFLLQQQHKYPILITSNLHGSQTIRPRMFKYKVFIKVNDNSVVCMRCYDNISFGSRHQCPVKYRKYNFNQNTANIACDISLSLNEAKRCTCGYFPFTKHHDCPIPLFNILVKLTQKYIPVSYSGAQLKSINDEIGNELWNIPPEINAFF
jgi:hypothetical protein